MCVVCEMEKKTSCRRCAGLALPPELIRSGILQVRSGKHGEFSNLKYSQVSSSNAEKDYQGKHLCFRKRPGA